jgi:hypothetical protein
LQAFGNNGVLNNSPHHFKKSNNMIKRIITLLLLMATSMPATELKAQTDKKSLQKEIKRDAPRRARREARRLTKEKYQIPAGALPLDKQLEAAWLKQYEEENGFPKYIVANATAVGNNYNAAKNQAVNLAKVELAGLIASQIASLAENSVANQDLSKQEAASVVKTVEASKNIIAQELGRVLNILEVYRTLPNQNVEVQVRLAYSTEMAADVTRKKIIKKLEDETKIAHEKLDKLMNMPDVKSFKKNSNVEENENDN